MLLVSGLNVVGKFLFCCKYYGFRKSWSNYWVYHSEFINFESRFEISSPRKISRSLETLECHEENLKIRYKNLKVIIIKKKQSDLKYSNESYLYKKFIFKKL